MATELPGMSVPNEEGSPIGPETSNARRASGARRSRRKKDDEDGENPKPKKEKEAKDKDKPARAPRRPREKSNATTNSRKKPKLEQSGGEAASGSAGAAPRPAADPNSHYQHQQQHQPPPPPSTSTPSQPTSHHFYTQSPHRLPAAHDSPYPKPQPYPRPQSQPTTAPPQRTSGQNYDPIRSAFDNPSPAPAYSPPVRPASPRASYRASASPAISSIIDPPAQTSKHPFTQLPRSSSGHGSTVSSPAPLPAMPHTPTHHSLVRSPMAPSSPSHGAVHAPQRNHYTPYTNSDQRPPQSQLPKLELSPPALPQQQQATPQPPPQPQPPRPADPSAHAATPQRSDQASPDAMDIDSKEQPAANGKKGKTSDTAPSSKAPSPKPARATKEAPPLPQGSGLITNALFGGVDDSKSSEGPSTPNIIVHIPLQKGNQIVNFAQLAEEQYGFAALHPRLAAHKDRLARVAAAGAALERSDKGKGTSAGESADEDLSLDAERDSDMDGDVTMGGAGTGTNGAPSETSEGKKKRRRKKVEEYDRDDPFVDDSEMAWQEQAAASKDGFFVYSGPLVPEGEKVSVERADGTIKRGRGRGRGTGRARALTSHPHVPIAAAVPISQDTGLPLRGPGSRGGTSRRARTTKKATEGDKGTSERSGTTASTTHEGRGGRGGGGAGRGASNAGTRGEKSAAPSGSSTMSMMDLAPATSSNSSNAASNSSAPGPSPLAKPELMMK